jgi:hypothetical protein
MTFRKQVDIDRYQLDEELVRQPQKYYDWAIKAVKAGEEKENAKHALDIVKADVEKRIRKNPERYGIDDPKESAIKLEIPRHPKVKRYTRKYIQATYNERVLNEAKTSFAQRKSMLQSLTQLNIQLHFAEVPVPKEFKETFYQREKKKAQLGLKQESKQIRRRKVWKNKKKPKKTF